MSGSGNPVYWIMVAALGVSLLMNFKSVRKQHGIARGRAKLVDTSMQFDAPRAKPKNFGNSRRNDDDNVVVVYENLGADDDYHGGGTNNYLFGNSYKIGSGEETSADSEDNSGNEKQYDSVEEEEEEDPPQPPETYGRNSESSGSKNSNPDESRPTDTSIRKWGCDLTETPLIFVHNGKSGGGNIRARMAASAENYTRNNVWKNIVADMHYYPIPDDNGDGNGNGTTIRRGRFCNSLYSHFTEMPHIEVPIVAKTFEGLKPCNATTPLGIAVACPQPYKDDKAFAGGIQLDHYRNNNCPKCDDDYYLEPQYYNLNTTAEARGTKTGIRRRLQNSKNDKSLKRDKNQKRDKNTRPPSVVPPFSETVLDPREDPPPGSTCDIVFTAHNNIGSELNWLPPRYLKEHWWDKSEFGTNKQFQTFWDRLLADRTLRRNHLREITVGGDPNDEKHTEDTSQRWCPNGYKVQQNNVTTIGYDRPSTNKNYRSAYESCSLPLADQADRAFFETFFPQDGPQPVGGSNFSPFYASMPLHRVTMMRDPWSWVVSKFFWHSLQNEVRGNTKETLTCADVTALTKAKGGKEIPSDPITGRKLGWMEQFALLYLIKLCGNDCRIRYENGMMGLKEIEDQVASNLRNAFSVVGILHEEESFYDMLTDRIRYVDLRKNLYVSGGDHATPKTDENIACKKLFGTNTTFQETTRIKVAAFAALERMYHLGLEVNAFQKEELRQCKLAKGEQPTRGNYKQPVT